VSSIAFFRPEFFWALCFISVIFLIHLLKRPRLIRLEFSTLRFFQKNAVKESSHRKLRKIIQLLARIFIVLILIFLFARPFNPGDVTRNLGDPQVSVFFWIDHTQSMEYVEDGKSIGQRSMEMVDSLSSLLPRTAQIYIFDHTMSKFKLFEQKDSEFRSFQSKIDVDIAIREFCNFRKKASNAVLILCSDFQKNSSTAIDSILSTTNRGIPILLLSVKPKSPWNYSIGNSVINNGLIQTTVRSQGKSLEDGRLVVSVNRVKGSESAIHIQKNVTDTVSIKTSINGNAAGKVSLDVKDPLQFDNIDYFCSDLRTKYRVIVIGNTQRNTILKAALNASDAKLWDPIILKSEAEFSYEELDSSDLIIINDLSGPSDMLSAFCSARNSDNHAIIFCIQSGESLDSWNKQLMNKAFPEFQKNTLKKNELTVYPLLPDTISSLWKSFPHVNVSEVKVRLYFTGCPGIPLLKYNNGDVFIWSSKDRAQRNWLLFSTPVGFTPQNNICETGFFVPLIDRLTRNLMSKVGTADENWIAGETHRNPFYGSRSRVSVFDTDGKVTGDIMMKQLLSFQQPGVYKVVPEKGSDYYIKVRAALNESDLSYSIPLIINDQKRSIVMIDGRDFISSVKKRNFDLFWIFPWLILGGLIIAEIVLWDRNRKMVT
jgi:hypothetical protein